MLVLMSLKKLATPGLPVRGPCHGAALLRDLRGPVDVVGDALEDRVDVAAADGVVDLLDDLDVVLLAHRGAPVCGGDQWMLVTAAGRSCRQGVAASICAASETIVVSLFGGPASWIARGRPSPSKPAGIEAAGWPT